jgi:hypothetical protein
MRVTASSRANALLALYTDAIWERFDEEEADPEEAFVLVEEQKDGVDIRIKDREALASALRVINGPKADHIAEAVLPPGTVMVMVVPLGEGGGLVVPLSREGKRMEGSA